MQTEQAEPDTWTRRLGGIVLATAIMQVIAPALTLNGLGESPGSGAGPDLLITPVGWAFSIWGVIYALAIAQAIAVLGTSSARMPQRLQVDQIVLHLGATAWIVCAGFDSSVATAAALTVMVVAAVDAVIVAGRGALWPCWLAILTQAAIGLYAGWVTAAFFLNLSTALVDTDVAGADELGWQLAVLGVAVVAVVVVLVASRGVPAYALAAVWALLGIAVTGNEDGNNEVIVMAVVAGVLIALVLAGLWVLGRRPSGSVRGALFH